MRPNTKQLLAVCITASVLGALAPASASAKTPGWMVDGTLLSGSKALATTAKTDEVGIIVAGGVTTQCSGEAHGISPQIESVNKGSAGGFVFTDCSSSTPSCTLSNKTVTTEPVTIEATLEGSLAALATLAPKTGTLWARIEYVGEECALAGVQPVTGKEKIESPAGQREQTVQQGIAQSGEIFVGSSVASVKGSALLKLANPEPWSFL